MIRAYGTHFRVTIALAMAFISLAIIYTPASASCCGVGGYNRSAAANYADLYYQNPNPHYAFYGDNDCTNFISQALITGGVLEKNVDGYISHEVNWFFNGGVSSYSWFNADKLMRHAYQYLVDRFDRNLTIGTYSSQALRAGDFIVFDAEGDPQSGPATHGRIGVGWLYDPDYGAYVYMMDQHSSSRYHVKWDLFWNPPGTNNWKISVHV